MRLAVVVALACGACAACASEYHPDYHPETSTNYSQTINYGTIVNTPAPSANSVFPVDRASRILVLQGTHLDRPAEVVGVVDAHLKVGDQDAALMVLRKRALDMGADAVVGVEFHHGEGTGEPIHLSGLAVRFLATLPLAGGGS